MTRTPAQPPGQHSRGHHGVLADLERRALMRIARQLPARINSDHLSTLALLSMLAAGVSFAAFRVTPWAALGVIVSLFANWFGDSLDGTVARVRGQQRPRYGFYVDHVIDLAGIAGLLCGPGLLGAHGPNPRRDAPRRLPARGLGVVPRDPRRRNLSHVVSRVRAYRASPRPCRRGIEDRLVSVGYRWTPGSQAVRCGRDCRDRGIGACVLRKRDFEHGGAAHGGPAPGPDR